MSGRKGRMRVGTKGRGWTWRHEATDMAIRIRKWNAEWSRHTRKTAERQGWEDTSRERRGARIVSLDHIFPDI